MTPSLRQLVFSHGPDLVAITAKDGRVLDVNENWTRTLGFSPHDIVSRPLIDFIFNEDRESVAKKISLTDPGELNSFECRHVARDGAIHWVSWRGNYLVQHDVVLYIGCEINILKHHNAVFERAVEQLWRHSGETFLPQLCKTLVTELGWDQAFIVRFEQQGQSAKISEKVQSLFSFPANENVEAFEIPFAAELLASPGGLVRHLDSCQAKKEDCAIFRNFGARVYFAHVIRGVSGVPIGVIALLHSKPLLSVDMAERLLRMFSIRLGVELERQLKNKLLVESTKRHQLIADYATDLITSHNLDLGTTYASAASASLLNCAPEDLIGTDPYRYIHIDDQDRVRATVNAVLHGSPTQTVSYRCRTKLKTWRWLETVVSLIPDAETRLPAEILCVSRDVTARKIEEEDKREHHYRQFLHFQQSPLAVVDFNTKGEITSWNPSAERIFGFTREQVLGQHYKMIVPDNNKSMVDTIWNDLLSQRGGFRSRNENLCADGSLIWCEWYNTPLIDGDGKTIGIASLVQDISDKLQAEELLNNQRMQMMAASKMSSLGEMAAGIAHEINNPLAIIVAHADLLARLSDDHRATPDKIRQTAEKINSTAHRIAQIVAGLRFFARDGAGDHFEEKSLHKIIDETLVFCRNRFRHHAISLEIRSNPKLNIRCRSVQISQVLLNLLNNAFDAVEQLADRWVELSVEDVDDVVFIRVTDSGSGIPQSVAMKIMTPFFTTKAVGRGTGLGLSIARGIVEAHGGELFLDRECANTCFVVKLPKTQQVPTTLLNEPNSIFFESEGVQVTH